MTTEMAIKQAGAPAINNMQDLTQVADMLAKSGFFSDARDAAKCGVKVLAGLESGFGAFASMTGIHLIQGKPTFGANLMAIAIKRSGRYNYRVLEHTDEVCRIAFYELWGGEWQEVGQSSFSVEDAKRAGLLSNQTWKNYPRNMTYARAMSNGVRWYAPDALGMTAYTPEELGANVDGEGNVIALPASSLQPPQALPEGPELATSKQLTALGIALKEAGFGTTEEAKVQGRAFLAWLAGVEQLESARDLTKQQAQRALDQLGEGENGAYRTDRAKLDKAFEQYTEYQAGQQFEREQAEAA